MYSKRRSNLSVKENESSYRFQAGKLSEEEIVRLRQSVLYDNQYLGSSVFEYVFGQFDNQLYYLLFDGHSKNLYEREGQMPSIILGRRGAGKSTYLNHLSQKSTVWAIGLKTWDLIDLIEEQVKLILEKQHTVDAEKCADIWHLVLLTIACVETAKVANQNSQVKEFISSLPIKDIARSSFIQITNGIVSCLKRAYLEAESNFDIELCLQALQINAKTLDSVESALSSTLLRAGKKAIFMLDNPERFTRDELQEHSMTSESRSRALTLSGLLNLAGRLNQGNVGLQIRFCIPTEQYNYLRSVSSNRRKDFGATQVLHWTSGEILSMAAHRYLIFLSAYLEFIDPDDYQRLVSFPIYTREGAIQFWNSVLAENICNNRGVEENALTYLLRHTQLVPRQLLDYLNKAVDLEIKRGGRNLAFIQASSIKDAIFSIEHDCSSEVIDSFSYSYPEANEMFELVFPKLPIITTPHEIKNRLYKTTDAKAVLQRYAQYPQVTESRDRFLRMCIETGLYGKVNHEPNDGGIGYMETEFEYTISGNLRVSDQTKLAMHPLFSSKLSEELISRLAENNLGIYPIGTNCEL